MTKPSYGKAESDVSINTVGAMTQGFYPLKVTVNYEHGLYDNNYEPIPSSLDKGTDSFIVEFNECLTVENSCFCLKTKKKKENLTITIIYKLSV